MEELLNNAPCGFLTFTDNGNLVEINQTLLGLLGYARVEELAARHIENILPVAGRIFYQTHFFPLLKLHGRIDEIYLSLRLRTGEDLPVLANAVRRERGGAFYNDCVFVPMHRRSRFEDEILQAKKEAEAARLARDEFLSVVSHELRTPLNAILGWTKILQKNMDSGTLERAVAAIERSAAMQKILIEDILDFERIAAGKLVMQIQRVELAEIIESAIDIITPAAGLKEISLETELVENGAVAADTNRLQQAFWNILSNAVKFTPPGGVIRVRLECRAPEMRVIVADNGQGITPEFLPHVFEHFRQGDASETKRHSGLGLGLAITRHIVELHGGTIAAESAGANRGATFTVSLPLLD